MSASVCDFSGNADMYGAGIRVGFYLQWYGSIAASWVAQREVPSLRFSNSLFVTATFLALVVQVNHDALRPVEIYIILLLTFGGYLSFVPLYIWRIVTCCTPTLDPSRYPRVAPGPIYSMLNFWMLVTVSLFQLWFWFWRAGSVRTAGCQEYGFFFARVRLDGTGFVAVNILLQFSMLLCCLAVLVITGLRIRRRSWLKEVYNEDGSVGSEGSELDDEIRIREVKEIALQQLHSFLNVVVASTVIAATELTIQWNGITNVNEITAAGQMIPLIIGIGQITRVLYIALCGDLDERYRIRRGPTDWSIFPTVNSTGSGSDSSTRS